MFAGTANISTNLNPHRLSVDQKLATSGDHSGMGISQDKQIYVERLFFAQSSWGKGKIIMETGEIG